MQNYGLVDLAEYDSSLILDLKYATVDNFVQKRVYPQAKAYLIEPAAQVLKKSPKKFYIKRFCLKVLDAYRPFFV